MRTHFLFLALGAGLAIPPSVAPASDDVAAVQRQAAAASPSGVSPVSGHAEPEEILSSWLGKEQNIFDFIEEKWELVGEENGK
jgi:hypothetical protein